MDEPAGYDLAEVEVDEALTPACKRLMDDPIFFLFLISTDELRRCRSFPICSSSENYKLLEP